MTRIAFGTLAAAVSLLGFLASGSVAPAARAQPAIFTLVQFEVTGVSLAPLNQTREITDTATVVATVTGVGCVFVESGPTTGPANSNCPIHIAAPSLPTPPITLGTVRFGEGHVQVVSGPHQGLDMAFTAPFDLGPFLSAPDGQVFSLSSQAVLQYGDPDHQVGTDNLVAAVRHGFFEVVSGLDAPSGPGPDSMAAEMLTSNPVDVRWIKTGAIDTGIFVRRTPVVEQAAAPAGPAVQAPATGTGRITAPNTGDAGLQASANSGSDLALPLAFALGLAGVGGVFVLHRKHRVPPV